jgi:hypothetical protein
MSSKGKSKTPPRVDARARGKLDDATLDRIVAHIEGGMPKAHACGKEGVSRQALYQLAERDPSVAERLEAASERGAEWYREQVMHADDDWKRWAWLAERLHPSTYAPPKQRVGLEGGAEGSTPVGLHHSGGVTLTVDNAVRIARQAKESGK